MNRRGYTPAGSIVSESGVCSIKLLNLIEVDVCSDLGFSLRVQRAPRAERRFCRFFGKQSRHHVAAARTCDTNMVMYGGNVVERGATARMLEDPQGDYTNSLISGVSHLSH